MKILLIALLVVISSCSLFTGFKRDTFSYTANNTAQTLSLKVPAGYSRVENGLDSAGNRQQVYYYASGSVLYFRHTVSLDDMMGIDTASNKPSQHPAGGWLYKGFDKKATYWKEYVSDSLRFGYKNVPYGYEAAFDSSINYAGYQKRR
ncbi:MAG TPA: hypothetical protein VM888_15480 [Chitinophagaceae bacterium]|jgi:hypothetical protein|nr:hypothetical protein [Chitinophagaceae bacterium]